MSIDTVASSGPVDAAPPFNLNNVTRFRKKPVVIDAWRFPCFEFADPGGAFSKGVPDWIIDAEKAGLVKVIDRPATSDWAHLEIKTLEGDHLAEPGDWIIRGIKGELYPCKDDIFRATYEPVDFLTDIYDTAIWAG